MARRRTSEDDGSANTADAPPPPDEGGEAREDAEGGAPGGEARAEAEGGAPYDKAAEGGGEPSSGLRPAGSVCRMSSLATSAYDASSGSK